MEQKAYLLCSGGELLLRGRRRRPGVVEHAGQMPRAAAVQVLLRFHSRSCRHCPAQRLSCLPLITMVRQPVHIRYSRHQSEDMDDGTLVRV